MKKFYQVEKFCAFSGIYQIYQLEAESPEAAKASVERGEHEMVDWYINFDIDSAQIKVFEIKMEKIK